MSTRRVLLPTIMGALVVVACSLGGCTVVPIGQEAKYTGQATFDAESTGRTLWDETLKPEVGENAVDLGKLLTEANGELTKESIISTYKGRDLSTSANAANNSVVYSVKGTGTVTEVVAKAVDKNASSKGYITVQVEGYSGNMEVHLAVGPVITDTSLRDSLASISLNDYKDTTQWSGVASSLNEIALSDVVEKTDIASIKDKKINFTGCFTAKTSSTKTIDITPIEINVS
ncbi:MAG: DUF2291 domain-containing protein [Coriobacteriaceae bacterium]|nr:DUF2291 domain-containing protein [Coriobacteriaceae bacterium]